LLKNEMFEVVPAKITQYVCSDELSRENLTFLTYYRPAMPLGKNILKDFFSSVLSQIKISPF